MYQVPVLFPQISNRESWRQQVQIADDDTGDLISLTDNNNIPLYAFTLEISPARQGGGSWGGFSPSSPSYDDDCDTSPLITATLADHLAIIDTGTIEIFLPKAVFQVLRAPRSYDVFMTVYDATEDDGRQLFVGRIPVLYGGRAT